MLHIHYKTIQIYIKRFLTWELNKLYLINLLVLNFHFFLQIFFFSIIFFWNRVHKSSSPFWALSCFFLSVYTQQITTMNWKLKIFAPYQVYITFWERLARAWWACRAIYFENKKIWENKFEYFCSNQLSHRHMRIRLNKYLLCVIISHSL